MILGLVGILLSLALLITLAYRGMTIIIAAPLCALVAMLFSGAPVLVNYTDTFMPALADFIGQYFPLFLTGAIFGKLMTVSGYATDLAASITRWVGPKRAMLATVLTTALLTYGGISVFVVVFVMFPLARELFRQAGIPRRLIPGAIAHGMLTFTMTALPGSPQVQNIIPGQAFETNTFAAPGVGILGGTVIFILGMLWLEGRKRRLLAAGEAFWDPTAAERKVGAAEARAQSDGPGAAAVGSADPGARSAQSTQPPARPDAGQQPALRPPNHLVPFIPILMVFAINFGCTVLVFPAMDWGHLDDYETSLGERSGVWAVLCAMLGAILSILMLNPRNLRRLLTEVTHGARDSLMPIFNTASEVGYGAVIASLAAFAIIRDGIFGLTGNALVTSAVSTSTIAGVTGSASGGMTIALNALGDDLQAMAADQGIPMEAMHRITAMASGGLDSMPHNGAVITLLLVCGMTHRESYKDVGVVSLVIPVLVTAALIPLVLATGVF